MFDLAKPETLGFSAGRLDRIAAFLRQAYLEDGRLPMAQLLVARDGQPVHYTRIGMMGEGRGDLRDNALFRIASMTKPVTSIAFMQLVEQCKVALEDPIAKVLPEFAGLGVYNGGGGDVPFAPTRFAGPITFAHLLTHMSGLTYGFQNRTSVDAAYREANLDLASRSLTSDEYARRVAEIPLEFAPGTSWNYSISTDVLGIAVERLSGMALGDYFEQHIFAPLGMADTAFRVADGAAERLVDAYVFRPGKLPRMIDRGPDSKLNGTASFHSGGGGLIGTIADYHRFACMLLGEGTLDGVQIVSPKTMALMTANHLPGGKDLTQMSQSLFSEANNAGTGFGLGFAMVIDPARTLIPSSMGEFYWGGAYSTAFFVDPLEKITMVFMTQVYPSSTYPIRRQLKTLIYSALTRSNA